MLKWKQNFLLVNLNRQHRRVLIGLSKLSQYTQTLNLPKSNFPIKHSRRLELGLENAVRIFNPIDFIQFYKLFCFFFFEGYQI